MFRVVKGEFDLTTPFPDAYITSINLDADEILVVRFDHILAFDETMFFNSVWKFDTVSLVSRQFRYIYFKGPGRVLLFGLGEIAAEEVNGVHDYDSGAVIAWTNTLKVGASSRSTFWSAFLNKEDICLHRFEGSGQIVTQASVIKKLPRRFHDESNNSSFVDYLNAVLGLRL